MLKSAVSTYVIDISRAYARKKKEYVGLSTKFHDTQEQASENHGDIIDILEKKLQIPEIFDEQSERFGSGTAADPELKIEQSEETRGLTADENKDSSRQVRYHLKLVKIHHKADCIKDDVHIAKYLHFEVEYQENGDHFRVLKEQGDQIEVSLKDMQVRNYHVVVVFPYDSQNKKGVVFFESRGNHSIVSPMRGLLKRAFSKIGEKPYTVNISQFADNEVIKEAVRQSRVKKIRLITNKPQTEHAAPMEYDSKEMIYTVPKGEWIMNLLERAISGNSTLSDHDFKDISDFQPDIVKIEVASPSGRSRTYTVGGTNNGAFQELLDDDVLSADGSTNPERFLQAVMEIYESHHTSMI